MYAPNNKFYQRIAKPLLSIRTTGSIDVECKVKSLKSKVLTKTRNNIKDRKAEMLFPTSQNLRQLMKIKIDYKRKGIPLPSTIARGDVIPSITLNAKVRDGDIESIDTSDSDSD